MWKRTLTVLPGVGVSLLRKLMSDVLACLYAGLLSSLGLGFLISPTYLLPTTAAFLLVAIVCWSPSRRSGFAVARGTVTVPCCSA